jgi:hypothetical protein
MDVPGVTGSTHQPSITRGWNEEDYYPVCHADLRGEVLSLQKRHLLVHASERGPEDYCRNQ